MKIKYYLENVLSFILKIKTSNSNLKQDNENREILRFTNAVRSLDLFSIIL